MEDLGVQGLGSFGIEGGQRIVLHGHHLTRCTGYELKCHEKIRLIRTNHVGRRQANGGTTCLLEADNGNLQKWFLGVVVKIFPDAHALCKRPWILHDSTCRDLRLSTALGDNNWHPSIRKTNLWRWIVSSFCVTYHILNHTRHGLFVSLGRAIRPA